MTRLLMTPVVTTVLGEQYPKYLNDHDPNTGVSWGVVGSFAGVDYALGTVWYGTATDIETTLAGIAAQPDVYAGWPPVVDGAISTEAIGATARQELSAYLETFGCPGTWVSNSDTWSEVAKTIAVFFQFARQLDGRGYPSLAPTGVSLNTRYSNLPADYAQAILDTFGYFNVPTEWITGNDQLRAIMREGEQQFTMPLTHGGILLP